MNVGSSPPPPVSTPADKGPCSQKPTLPVSPFRHRQVLANAGLDLHKRILYGKNPRPHRLVFDCTSLMEDADLVTVHRPAGDSPDKENEAPGGVKLTAEKLPALAPRFVAPKPPGVPLALHGQRVLHYSTIVARPPADGDDGGPRQPRPNRRWAPVAPVTHRPVPVIEETFIEFPDSGKHGNGLDPLDYAPELAITPAGKVAGGAEFEGSPLTPFDGLTPRPFDEDEHRVFKLFENVRAGKVAAVRASLRNLEVTPNARDEFGNTILVLAAESGDRDMARLALRFGVDVNCSNFSGSTALHVACANGPARMCKWLVRHGADAAIINDAGLSALDINPALASPSKRRC